MPTGLSPFHAAILLRLKALGLVALSVGTFVILLLGSYIQVGDDVVEQLQKALAEMGSEHAKVVCLVRIFNFADSSIVFVLTYVPFL